MTLNHVSKSVVGLIRSSNEDFIGDFITKDNLKVFVVCDGMGGHVGGATASQTAVNSIIEYFNGNPNGIVQVALKEALEFANIQIFGESQMNLRLTGMGTTCVVLAEKDGLFYLAHVGDSRCYIISDNKLYRMTKDHSYVQTLVDNGEITDAEMESHPRKNELTKALGITDYIEVDIAPNPIKAQKGDKFLLCSDGLTGLVKDKLIAKTIRENSDIQSCVNKLIELAEDGGGHDNISVDLIEVVESEHRTSNFVSKNNTNFYQTQTQDGGHGKTTFFFYSKVIFAFLILSFIVYGVYYTGIGTDIENTGIQLPKVEVNNEDFIKLRFESYFDAMNISSFHEDFMRQVENSPKLKESNFIEDFQIFYFSKENREMSIDEYRKYFGKSSKWNINKHKRSKDDYLKILVKDSLLYDPSRNDKEIEKSFDLENENIIFSEKQIKEDERARRQAEEEKRKQEEELKEFNEKKEDSVKIAKQGKKKKIEQKEFNNKKNDSVSDLNKKSDSLIEGKNETNNDRKNNSA